MMTATFQAVVVGMGPAGMAAAIELAAQGVHTAIIDQANLPGGQIYRQPPASFQVAARGRQTLRKQIGAGLLADFNSLSGRITLFPSASVWGSFGPNQISLLQGDKLMELIFEVLIICEGASERVIPFPGWTLPGVMTAGGLQKMIKHQGLLPGKQILIAGSGPLLLAAGAAVLGAGGRVAGLCEASSAARMLPMLPELGRQPGLFGESWTYLSALMRGRTLLKTGWTVMAARGGQRVREVDICRVDSSWNPIPSSRCTLEVDAVALGFGFQAQTRLSRLMGCRTVYDMPTRAFRPETDLFQRTSRPEVYVAGDGAGIGGATMAEIQGHLAGLHASLSLKQIDNGKFAALSAPWLKKKRRTDPYVKRLDEIFTPRDGIYRLMDPDTVVCRCEGVTAGHIWRAIDEGCHSLTSLKPSRVAMGPCQGRGCESVAAEMLRLKGVDPANMEALGLRPPLSPIPASIFENHAVV